MSVGSDESILYCALTGCGIFHAVKGQRILHSLNQKILKDINRYSQIIVVSGVIVIVIAAIVFEQVMEGILL